MLLDLSGYLPETTEPGVYDLTLNYGRTTGEARVRQRVVFVAPNGRQRAELAQLLPGVRRAGSWGEWARSPTELGGSELAPRVRDDDPARYYRILRYLIFGAPSLARVSLDVLAPLRGIYAPEAAVLRAELLSVRGRRGAYRRQLEAIAGMPGMAHAVDQLERGQHLLEHEREGLPPVAPR